MTDVTESWHTFVEAEGAEYLAFYVTIWHCTRCGAVAGVSDGAIEWVMEQEEMAEEQL